MKVILSRKGYDAENGGGPSPILPDGRLVSLPIPSRKDGRRYGELGLPGGGRVVDAIAETGALRGAEGDRCHLDPDLCAATVRRQRGWRPSFGQVGAAGRHLDNQGVGVGDVFLFFGWFRPTERVDGRLRFVRGAGQDRHVIFGWLEVGAIVRPAEDDVPAWLADHPHCEAHRRGQLGNRIYLASERLTVLPARPGAGLFRWADGLTLTAPGLTRTRWALSRKVFGSVELSYHSAESWRDGYFQSAAKGQEFVMTADPGVRNWLRARFAGQAVSRR